MANTFGAHIFKRRQVGEREEITIKLFKPDGSPLNVGEAPDLSVAVLAAWKGTYDDTQDYPAGSLVRLGSATYLALLDAPHTALGPGETVEITRFAFYKNGDRNAYVLPRDVEVNIVDLEGSSGYNFAGQSKWFRIVGTPGESLTFVTTGDSDNAMAFYDHGDVAIENNPFPSPKTVVVPADGSFNMEVDDDALTFRYYGPTGPQPVPNSPWVLFA